MELAIMSSPNWKAGIRLAFLSLTASACASEVVSDEIGRPVVTMVTDLGRITLEIYEREAPLSAGSFLKFIDDDLYPIAVFCRHKAMRLRIAFTSRIFHGYKIWRTFYNTPVKIYELLACLNPHS